MITTWKKDGGSRRERGERACKLKSNLFCVFLLWLEEEEAFIDWSGRTDLERNLLWAPTTTMVCSPPENHSTDSQHNSQHTRALRTNYLLMRSTILCRRHEKDMWGELGTKKMICLPEVVYVCTQISSVTAGSLIDMNSTPPSSWQAALFFFIMWPTGLRASNNVCWVGLLNLNKCNPPSVYAGRAGLWVDGGIEQENNLYQSLKCKCVYQV